MPTRDEVLQKFGCVAEAAQLLETELGNVLMDAHVMNEGLLQTKDRARVADLLASVNRQTLGQLLKSVNNQTESLDHLEALLSKALAERNRLFHSFYRQHNFRLNSDEGRSLMLEDLKAIHSAVFDAYKAVMKLTGVDLDSVTIKQLPTGHLPI